MRIIREDFLDHYLVIGILWKCPPGGNRGWFLLKIINALVVGCQNGLEQVVSRP